MTTLSREEIEDVRDVFDLFDFWDGRDGMIDSHKVGDLLRCIGLNPTLDICYKNGMAKKMGEGQYKFEEFLPIYQAVSDDKDKGTHADFVEAFKTFDREGQGYISSAELRHVLTALGEKLKDEEVDEILKYVDLREDLEGNVKYEEFIKRVMAGPFPDK
ncbi:myosin essential light chain, striated adductor muscle-like [Liolophura sinensis]|uniref:myosin essential light chain, striated adductor muscle-like n=1 Tax=Liolophura sinensis TaxID=3198878 RepID=UPI0031580D30